MENITIKDKLGIICSVCKDVILDDNDFIRSIIGSLSIEDKIRLGEWIPCSEHLPKDFGLDWVLVQFVENGSGFVGVPYIAEQRRDGKWHLQSGNKQDEDFINDYNTAASWKIIEFSPERIKSGNVWKQ